MVKILYDTIKISNKINPIYIKLYGIIIDETTKEIIYQFKGLEYTKYFYFTLEFGHYLYSKYYQPLTKSYQNKLSHKIYYIYLNLNIQKIKLGTISKKIGHFLSEMQIKNFQMKKNYTTSTKNIEYFIKYRDEKFLYLIPWYQIRINDEFIFDLKQRKFLSFKQVPKIKFIRKGGIIETDNVRDLIAKYFKNNKNTLIILPTNMTNLWPGARILTYDKLLSMSKSNIAYYQKKNISRIIIHECHSQFLVHIKLFINNLPCDKIWIINSLPLKYYFVEETPTKKFRINQLSNIISLWLGASVLQKKKYKTEIIRFLFSKFNQIYTIVNYETHNSMEKIILKMNPLEKEIYQNFQRYYDNWKNKLTNDPNNIYSITTREKSNFIESKIHNTIMLLIMSIVPLSDIPKFFQKQTKKCISKMELIDKRLENLIKYTPNCHVYYKSHIEQFLAHFRSKKNKIGLALSNYQRYHNGHVYKNFDNVTCPICYSDDKIVKTQLICGHSICLECIQNILAKSNFCPICSEFININKIAIIKETINQENYPDGLYQSEIINYFSSLGKTTIIITDLSFLDCMNISAKVLNIMNDNIVIQIKKIRELQNIVLLIASEDIPQEIRKLVNYFQLFTKCHIYRISICT